MNPPTRSSPGPLLIALAYVGFVSLGLPDAVIGVAWPTVRDTFRTRGLTIKLQTRDERVPFDWHAEIHAPVMSQAS